MGHACAPFCFYVADLDFVSLRYVKGDDIFSKTKERFFPGKETITTGVDEVELQKIVDAAADKNLSPAELISKQANEAFIKNTQAPNLGLLEKFGLNNKLLMGLAAGTLGMTALMGNMEPDEIQDMQRGEGLDIDGIRAEVQEAMADETGEKLLALRTKYPYLGTQASKNTAIMANGGRIGYADAGAVLSKEQIAMMQNMVKKGMDNSTISTVANVSPEQVQNYIDSLKVKMENKAYGGRIGFDDGGSTSDTPLMDRVIELQDEGLDISSAIAQAIEELQARDKKAEGGIMDLGGKEKDYRNTGGFVDLGAKEKADDVPARLSVNEFVFTADAVRNAGGGDIDQGAEVMENMMKHLEQGGQVSEESQGMAGARDMFATSQRLSEVI